MTDTMTFNRALLAWMAVAIATVGLLFTLFRTVPAEANPGIQSGLIPVAEYDYPISNPLRATLVGTPNEFKADLAIAPLEPGQTVVFPERNIPELFWYLKGLPYAIAAQEKAAPLMFVIAGTGAGHLAAKMVALASMYYEAGYHVAVLSSPTHPAFIAAASEESMPGRIATDVADLINVMKRVKTDISRELEITSTSVSGYSLGGMHALFIAERAERTGELEIDKAIAVNPPVSLVESISKLDRMLVENLPGGLNKVQAFYERVFGSVAEFYSTTERLDFSDDFLFRLQKQQNFDDPFMAALISLSFRISLANMLFSSDVVADSGFIKPKGYELSPAQPLSQYFQASARFTFEEYIDDYLVPYFRQQDSTATRDFIANEADLRSIEAFLATSPSSYLVTNADDIILKPGDAAYLQSVFKDRALIFPKGGHMGNLDEKRMVAHLISIAKGE